MDLAKLLDDREARQTYQTQLSHENNAHLPSSQMPPRPHSHRTSDAAINTVDITCVFEIVIVINSLHLFVAARRRQARIYISNVARPRVFSDESYRR